MTEPHRLEPAFLGDDPHARSDQMMMHSGALSFCRRPYLRSLQGIDLAIIGVPYDTATSGRSGTRGGPRGIRAASTNLAWSHCWPQAFDPFDVIATGDWGDIAFDFGRPQGIPGEIEAAIAHVITQGPMALILGGDHFITYPSLRAHAAKHGDGLSLIHFDAHCDTGIDDLDRIDHGTMFYHAAEQGIVDPKRSIQIGIRTTYTDPSDYVIWDANQVQEHGVNATVARIREVVGDNRCYITFDIDCLDPAYAPGTGTPVCGGLSTWQAKEILRRLEGINLIGMDVVEVSPPYDHAEITALAGATLALELVCLAARLRK